MTRSGSAASGSSSPRHSDSSPATTLTERLLDVMIDLDGVRAAFIVNDFGELLAVRFSPAFPRSSGFPAALEAAAGLRAAASSGLEPPPALVHFALGRLYARRFRRSYLCVWATRPLAPRSLELSSRLVAASLPPDRRMEAVSAPRWDQDDQRPTEPWLGHSGAPRAPALDASLRAPRVPREWADTERNVPAHSEPVRARDATASGIRNIAPEPPRGAQRQRGR
ncbi:MAG TPA: hypothetical protein VG963_19160 [Polyangiaceae bacterium]|nr:hypothetical protein [Polyangiaceae bacterium]